MKIPCPFDNSLGSAGVLARRARRPAGHISPYGRNRASGAGVHLSETQTAFQPEMLL